MCETLSWRIEPRHLPPTSTYTCDMTIAPRVCSGKINSSFTKEFLRSLELKTTLKLKLTFFFLEKKKFYNSIFIFYKFKTLKHYLL